MAPQVTRADLPAPFVFGLPFAQWRESQASTILIALSTKKRVVAIQAPTGVGKTTIGTGIVALANLPATALTATKALQTQYGTTSSHFTDIRGAGNYECHAALKQFRLEFMGRRIVGCDEGPCRVGIACELKTSGCDYFDRVKLAQSSDAVLTSYAYHVAYHRFGEGLGPRKLLLLDEAHDAPTQLANQLTVEISKYDGAGFPSGTRLKKADWRAWAQTQLPDVKRASETMASVKDRLRYKQLTENLSTVAALPPDWVWERDGAKVRFAPVVVKDYAEKALFRGAQKIVLMSATLTRQTLIDLGLNPDTAEWIKLRCPFPKARRPIYIYRDPVLPIRMDYRVTPEVVEEWLYQIREWCLARADRKGIIHSVSYDRSYQIARALQGAGLHLHVPGRGLPLEHAIAAFRRAGPGSILISPAMTTGIDFPYRDAEYLVVPKVPFPDIRTAIAKARQRRDANYRNEIALQTLLQMIGRAMRAVDDQCEVAIFDEHVVWFIKQERRKGNVPDYIWEALKFITRLPEPLPKLRRAA